jgi:hypothetical protein
LYNILIEFGIPMKLVRLIKMCLNETYSKVRVGKHLSDNRYCMYPPVNHHVVLLITIILVYLQFLMLADV